MIQNPSDDGILDINTKYTVATNDGREFRSVIFKGYKLLNGKPMMVFRTKLNSKVSINPSYFTFVLEEDKDEEPRYIDA